ncbi:MAG: DUF3343 domain-containing protein [Clostridia bacterium]|nr:DUF3343 domain-containing protein [Clostridia bacterium]
MTRDLIIVFKSKTEVFEFIDRMNAAGAFTTTTGTPKEAKIGCGISAKTNAHNVNAVHKVLSENDFDGFFGVYSSVSVNGRTSRTRLV